MTEPIETAEGTGTEEGGTGGASEEVVQQPASNARGTGSGQSVAVVPQPKQPAARVTPAAAAWDGKTLNERLSRERQAVEKRWLATLGVANPEEAKALIAAAKQREAEDKERKFAEMTELDRAKATIADKEAEIERLKTEYQGASTQVLVERQDRIIGQLASEFVKPSAMKFANYQYKEHLRTLTEEQVDKLKERDVKKFFAEFVKEHPELGITAAAAVTATAATPTAVAKPVARRTITTGAPPPKVPASKPNAGNPLTFNGKTPLPGRPNSMNSQELKAYAKANGIEYPSVGPSPRSSTR